MRSLFAAALVAAFLFPAAAAATPACMSHADMVALLAERYGEHPIGRGVTNRGALLELFAAADGTTWTWVVTAPGQASCMVAAGAGWIPVRNAPQGEGA